MRNVMAALPNIGGALCSTPRSLADDLSRLWAEVHHIMGHMEEILLLNKFLSDCRYVPYLRRYCLTKLWDVAEMATFWRFFACCIFSELRAARFRPAFFSSSRNLSGRRLDVYHTSTLGVALV